MAIELRRRGVPVRLIEKLKVLSPLEACLIDARQGFAAVCRLRAPALVLVRPDGYVGWSTGLD